MKPTIFSTKAKQSYQKVVKLHSPQIVDHQSNIAQELASIRAPQSKHHTTKKVQAIASSVDWNWVHFPWNNTLVKLPDSKTLFELKTTRNKHLITLEEQTKLRKARIAFLGMSVGSHAGITWMMQSHADSIILADFDNLDGSNLNRIRSGWHQLGKPKITIVSEQIYEQNPYATITTYPNGVNKKNIKTIISQSDVVVEAIDSIDIKVQVRQEAKRRKVPVIMATDIGHNVKIDIERYDLTPQPAFFNQPKLDLEKTDISQLSSLEKRLLAIQIVGTKNNSEAMLYSLTQIGKTITTWPQLAAAATMSGGIIASILTKIVQNRSVESGIYWLHTDNILEANYYSEARKKARKKLVQELSDK